MRKFIVVEPFDFLLNSMKVLNKYIEKLKALELLIYFEIHT